MRELQNPKLKPRLLRANKLAWMVAALLVFTLIVAACGAATPADDGGAAAEPAAEEATAAEATEPAAEEEAAEAEATEPAEEEAAEAEATEPAEEEAAEAEATAPAEEEAAEVGEMSEAALAGEYVFTLTGGCGCHNNRDLGGLAGGNEFEGPFGKVYASNITPDVDTGIGGWSAEEIALVLHTGATPDEQLVPVMPFMRLSALSDKEAMDLAAYLLSLDPIANEVPAREVAEEPAAFTPAVAPPAEPPTDPVARGEQLVGVIDCAGCHTPKNDDGSSMADMMLAGAPLREEYAANITPDEETGIGTWSEEEIATFMQTGTYPDGSQVEGAMAQQIERRFSVLTDDDASAIAAYLKSIPAVVNAAPE